MSQVPYLECTKCGAQLSADQPLNVCPKDGGVLFARYDLPTLQGSESNLWRYCEVQPEIDPITL